MSQRTPQTHAVHESKQAAAATMQIEPSAAASTEEEKGADAASSHSDAAASIAPAPAAAVTDLAAGGVASATSAGSKRKSSAAPAASSSSAQSEVHPQTASAPHASDPPSNAHLASVLESPAAADPVSKRTRQAQQKASSAAASLAASPMMRLLGRDSGARQSLIQMLKATDLASLLRSGRSWRAWIEGASSSVGSQQIYLCKSLAGFADCGWVHRFVQDLTFNNNCGGQLDCFVPCLRRLPRLRSLHLYTDEVSDNEDLLREGFSAVTATLKELNVNHCPGDCEGRVPALWSALSVLTGLECLIFGTTISCHDFDFAFLRSMPQLQRFHLQQDGGGAQICSDKQIEALSQCAALTDLQCGQFLPSCEHGPTRPQARQALIDRKLSKLFRRRSENGAAPLRHLYLGSDSVIEPMGWRVLSQQCTELEEIESSSWSLALTADDWLRLGSFLQLHSLHISSLPGDAPLDMDRVCGGLVRCRALRSLSLCYAHLRTVHVTALARLPTLERFEGWFLRVESLTPLSTAPALHELRFQQCTGINGESINIREMIPPMPLVDLLAVVDQLTEVDAEPLISALLHRLPRLTREGLRADL